MGLVVNAASGQLYPREKDLVPILREAGCNPKPVWMDTKISLPTEIRTPDRPTRRTLPLMGHYWNDLKKNLKWVVCFGSWFSAFKFLILYRHGFCLRVAISHSISELRHWFHIEKFINFGHAVRKTDTYIKVLFKHKIFLTGSFCPEFKVAVYE